MFAISSTSAAQMHSDRVMSWTGKITSLSPMAHTVTVLENGWTETFRIDDHTKLSTLNKAEAKLGDFERGEEVLVHYRAANEGITANSVEQEPAK